ncbi:putative protein N(5)-glutamine methyltransferase [Salinibacterium hongtaonis]|nr:putative protein N(5)-glutamine methyltransferase [Salinibacterium hongtaonis]
MMTDDDVVAALRAAGCVFAEDEAALLRESADSNADLERMLRLRVEGLPLERILGWAEFRGLRIAVAPAVFVPRRRTEWLAERAIALSGDGSIVLDLCCGSGAIAASIAAQVPGADVYASDIDPVAAAVARHNVGAANRVFEGDLFDALPAFLRGRVNVLVANAPYVPTDEVRYMPTEARVYEAIAALDGGVDGLDVQRRVVAGASEWLTETGWLLIETSERQAPLTAGAFDAAGFTCVIERDESCDATIVVGRHRRGV